MAVKLALAVGLFIVICGPPGLKSSQVIPDGLIYTEDKKILVRGAQGVLTCRFYGVPLAVYWRKGLDLDDLSPVVAWHDGKVSGPRFEDGSCDVDENYSLIINDVSTADAGRMYCTVSNNKGPLMNNYTDISVVDTAITTTPRVTLHIRQSTYGILQCTVHIKARRVSWKRGTTSSANESLVVMESDTNVTERSGAGYDEGMYNITHDHSLVINQLQIHHEGLYVCEVTDDTGMSFRNQTFVNVFAQPLEPFPTIQECLNAEPHDSTYCTLVAKSGMTLTCQAVKYYPSINLVFLYGSKALEPLDTREWNNTDGTKNKTITIATGDNKELYTCMAFNTPGTKANKSTSVLLHGDEPVKSTLVIIIVLFAVVTVISSVVYYIWRKKHHFDVKELTKSKLQELEQRVDRVLMKHYKSVHDASNSQSFEAEKIISENRTALFDTHQMLIDWQQRPTSTSSQYKRAYQLTDIIADNSGPQQLLLGLDSDDFWPTNEELKSISCHLTQESMKEICKELQIVYSDDDAKDEGKRFDGLCKWRNKASDQTIGEIFRQLASVLGPNNLIGLLPNSKGPYVYKADLVDLAFRLLMHDLLPIAKELGISDTKLVSYRPAFQPTHLEIGTIKLLTELGEDHVDIICSILDNLAIQNIAFTGLLVYDMSYGELCSISEAINQCEGRRAHQATSGMLSEELGNLQDVLQLTDQDIAGRLHTSHPLTAFALMKIWKEKPRSSVFNYRAALAQELRRTGMPGLADEIIAEKYNTEQTSLTFIDNMVRGLNQHEISSLGKILQLSGENEQWHATTSFNEITHQIYDWVAHWTKGIEGSWDLFDSPSWTPGMKATAKKHRDLNDKLLEHGFLELTREIMIIERQLVWS